MISDHQCLNVVLFLLLTTKSSLSSLITFSSSFSIITEVMKLVKHSDETWDLRYFMIDKSEASFNAITAICTKFFRSETRNYMILLCWFHITQAIKRWMVANRISKANQAKILHTILPGIRDAPSQDRFWELATAALDWANSKEGPNSSTLRNYLYNEWFGDQRNPNRWLKGWAVAFKDNRYVAVDLWDINTNNWLESFNRGTEYSRQNSWKEKVICVPLICIGLLLMF
jgi:hypothetical protein